MSRIAFLQDLLSSVFQRQPAEVVREDDRSFAELCEALLAERAEMAGNRLAQSIFARFDNADDAEREGFFRWLSEELDVDPQAALSAAQHYARNTDIDNLAELMRCTEPRRQELFRRLNRLPGSTARLVEMRRCLLALQRSHPALARVDLDFSHLLGSWFNRGFLVLREIDWHAPANVLEKIIAYEAVHAIDSWHALRQRLEPEDRKCFAFFHPAMLDEPLIFVEVALMRTIPDTIASILEPEHPPLHAVDADTAVFYSISNCQRGLAGVHFGNSLIKQVVNELSAQLPGLSTFRTLSPVPGFIAWLEQATSLDDEYREAAATTLALARENRAGVADTNPAVEAVPEPAPEPEPVSAAARLPLQKLLAHFLVDQRRDDHQPLDPVARFHLGNGASLDAILPAADTSDEAIRQSAGAMVSYLYDVDRVDINQEAYAHEHSVEVSAALAQQLSRAQRTSGQTGNFEHA